MRCLGFLLGAASFAVVTNGASAQALKREIVNIYASVPMSDPDYIRKGEAVRIKLMRCGMDAQSDETRNLPDLTPNLFVVLTGPHRTAQSARTALDKAAACGVTGYTRQTRMTGD